MKYHINLKKADAALVFVTGQSNAHAHAQFLSEKQRITIPLQHVFSLDRNPNQIRYPQKLEWSGFTSSGKNLAEAQDHTASFAYYLARQWEHAINNGHNLPPLYIVQLSIGAQGIVNGMWNPEWPDRFISGPLGIVDIALYSYAQTLFPLVADDLSHRFASPIAIGLHWFGSEQDGIEESSTRRGFQTPDFQARYDTFFDGLMNAVTLPCPLYLYKNVNFNQAPADFVKAKGVCSVNSALERQALRFPNAAMVTPECSTLWNAEKNNGIFADDLVHYTAATQEWFANRFFIEVLKDSHFI